MVYSDSIESSRPEGYQYFNQLKLHLGGDLSKIFNGELVYPRQIEIHLPGDGVRRCNFNCFWCQGNLLDRSLGNFEEDLLRLLEQLKGKGLHYVVYGGNYTEPLLNSYSVDFLKMAKAYLNVSYGIHTNGSLLLKQERDYSYLSEFCRLANSHEDFLSVSLDSGNVESHMRGHNLDTNLFDTTIDGIREAIRIRGSSPYPSVRICYLLNKFNSSPKELEGIVKIAKDIGVDSIKFSIPYDLYGKDFSRVREYKRKIEIKKDKEYRERLLPLLTSQEDKTHVFYLSPFTQDVDRMNFRQCIYGYFQISAGADGYWYKCSSTASPSFSFNRLQKITSSLDGFHKAILRSQSPDFNPSLCFNAGARCNRMALECNKEWEARNV